VLIPLVRRLRETFRRPGIWLLLALFLTVTLFQVGGYLRYPIFISDLTTQVGLTRYTIERILYLLPITWAAFYFGWRGGASTSLAALFCMLPRALFDSPVSEDAIVETGAVFLVGNLISYSLESLRRERKRRVQLESIQEEEQRMQEHLHFLLQQVNRAQEEERKRIARELHDDTIQALVIHYQQLYDLSTNIEGLPEPTNKRIGELLLQTNRIIEGLRRLSQDLRPTALDRLGLLPALKRLASDVATHSGVETSVKVLGTERRLPVEAELVLFRIAQEALRNVWKHAEATSAEVTVEFTKEKIWVIVSDNGRGFDILKMRDSVKSGKLGLAGMVERAKLLGGTLVVSSEPGKGTTLIAELPAQTVPKFRTGRPRKKSIEPSRNLLKSPTPSSHGLHTPLSE
jgi:two-component system sensor histidine kinase DegS